MTDKSPLLGGVGGIGLLTLKNVRIEPMKAGTNHTMFMRGMSPEVGTSIGVRAWPKTRPSGFDSPSTVVATILWRSLNQFWLT